MFTNELSVKHTPSQDDSTDVRNISYISSSKALKLITGFFSGFCQSLLGIPSFIRYDSDLISGTL